MTKSTSLPESPLPEFVFLAGIRIDEAIRRAQLEGAIDASDRVNESVASTIDGETMIISERWQSVEVATEAPPVFTLPTVFGLSRTEQQSLYFVLALRRSPALQKKLNLLGSEGRRVSADVLARCVHECDRNAAGALRELSPTGKLVRLGLLDASRDDNTGDLMLAGSDRLVELAMGPLQLPAELEGLATLTISAVRTLDQVEVSSGCRDSVERAVQAGAAVLVTGARGAGRRTLLRAAAMAAGHAVLEVDARRLSHEVMLCQRQLRALAREARLHGAAPLVAHVDVLSSDSRLALLECELLDQVPTLVLMTGSSDGATMATLRPVVHVQLGPVTSAQRAAVWRTALGPEDVSHADVLTTRFPLAPGIIHAALATARTSGDETYEGIAAGVRSTMAGSLASLATRVTTTQTWSDLVLPPEHAESINELVARVRDRRQVYENWGFGAKVGRGLGVAALMSGPPGTGKTMVAGLIAKELGMDLFQVDLAKVTSKWLGETEKHLGALFDAAESGHVALLFDEADSLFGKRTEVKSSNDRHANLEVNYLLQRLERFEGLCLLTSNHESAIDGAFQRRLAMHLRFSAPDVRQRAALWRAMLPVQAPMAADIDVVSLARNHDLCGGHIRNAVVRAAFLASLDDLAIGQNHLHAAARSEAEAMGRLPSN